MDKPFLQTLNLYRSKSALQISPSPELALVFVSLAPVIPGMENKMPDKNTKKYLWDKKLTASFNFEGALEVAAAAAALAEGKENLLADSKGTLPSWYRDPAKCGRDGNAKIIGFYRPKDPPNGSKVRYFLGITENSKNKDGQKIGISLEYPDLFKIARVMEEAALAILGWRKQIEERCDNNGHASPGTSDPHTSNTLRRLARNPALWPTGRRIKAMYSDSVNGTLGKAQCFRSPRISNLL